MSVLSVVDLTVRFGGLLAVDRVSFSVNRGEIFSIIGPNGAGKTTVFNSITGLTAPSGGRILSEGREIAREIRMRTVLDFVLAGLLCGISLFLLQNIEIFWQAAIADNYTYRQPFPAREAIGDLLESAAALPMHRSSVPLLGGTVVGFLGALSVWRRFRRTPDVVTSFGVSRTFQNIRLFPQMSVLENVLVGMEPKLESRFWTAIFRTPFYRAEEAAARKYAEDLLRFTGLAELTESPAAGLPYGVQRRLEIARALASEPTIVLLDEPAAGMNPVEVQQLTELISQIRDRGTTVLLIEHHMNVVMAISDRIVVLDFGRQIAEGTPEEIRSNPRVIEAYLGKESTT